MADGTRREHAGELGVALERLLRMYIAQQCLGLSGEGIEDAIYDSQAIRGFVGIDVTRKSAPDSTTLLKFRRLLKKHNLTRRIFDGINGHLASSGSPYRSRCPARAWRSCRAPTFDKAVSTSEVPPNWISICCSSRKARVACGGFTRP